MKIIFKENKTIEIVRFRKLSIFNLNDIDKINIKFINFLIVKIYYLNILTKDRKIYSFFFLKNDKESIKREVFYIINFMSSHLE